MRVTAGPNTGWRCRWRWRWSVQRRSELGDRASSGNAVVPATRVVEQERQAQRQTTATRVVEQERQGNVKRLGTF